VGEPGERRWAYLFRMTESDTELVAADPSVAAAIAWTDGDEDGDDWSVQLLTIDEAEQVLRNCSAAIADETCRRYRAAGGADDLRPAYRLHVLSERRRKAVAKTDR